MKRILLIAAFFVSTGVITSCTKDNVSPSTSTTSAQAITVDGQLATGDGGVDRPPVKKP